MIFDALTLQDFGVYAGRQTIELAPPDRSRPVVLIGGLNGGGKTSFIDAIQLCLFGAHAKLSNRGSSAYLDYLGRCIHRGSGATGASIELSFRHTVEGREESYFLRRSWRKVPNGHREDFEVVRNGVSEPGLAENWATQVEDFMPSQIAHLFLFDGEQIESYAADDNSSVLIGAAIQNLLGLDMVDQLDKDLVVYERRKRTESKDEPQRQEVARVEAALAELTALSGTLSQERASLQSHGIDRKQKTLKELEARYRKVGGPLYEQRGDLERNLAKANDELAECVTASQTLAAGGLPLCMLKDLMASAAARDQEEQRIRASRDVVAALEERDRAVIEHVGKNVKDAAALKSLRRFLDADRTERMSVGKGRTLLDLPAEARLDLQFFMRDGGGQVREAAAAGVAKQRGAAKHAARLEQEHQSIPGKDSIAEIVRERETLRRELAELYDRHGRLGSKIERVARDVERTQTTLARLLEADAKIEGQRQDRDRVLRHSVKVRSVLTVFRKAVVERHVQRIERLVLESYRQLLRKSALLTGLTIDPESFRLTLFGRDGTELQADRLSAGERQLLAIAILWGLAKSSGRPLPTAIDTPLGRLDMKHRTHLVEKYFPFASHQVLLLSTDEEITGRYLERLKPWIGRSYQLVHDDRAGTTTIVPGYFEEREAA